MPVLAAGPERALTWAGEPLNAEADGPFEPRDKLDTVAVNGPEDVPDWDAIDWRSHEAERSEAAAQDLQGDAGTGLGLGPVLQKMMLGSWSNTLVSVRQVTQRNAGRRTAGVDGQVALSSQARADTAVQVHRTRCSWDPLPVRRVHIPKANGKQRPLGIPVILDRCHQARVKNALEPEWEARFEPRSYGFRPGRGCADAIGSLFSTLSGPHARRVWILDADLSAAFDKIDHSRLLDALGAFPARDLVERWLKAGVIEDGRFTPTDEGSPQGGVISPLLMNVALHGLEEAAGVRYRTKGVHAGKAMADSPILVRYADDTSTDSYVTGRQVRAGCGRRVPSAVLAGGLGDRYGHPAFFTPRPGISCSRRSPATRTGPAVDCADAAWLKAPLQQQDGTLVTRDRGLRGSAISPLIANLFMHYAFDTWLARTAWGPVRAVLR